MIWADPSPGMAAVLSIAQGEIGVEEMPHGSNRGERVEQYLAAASLPPGNPWCAAFICWCVQQARDVCMLRINLPRSGYTPVFKSAPGCQVLQTNPAELAPGMLFLLFYPSLGRVGHIGLIEGPDPDDPGRVITIEGNSNDEGAREGYEVCRRSRRIDSLFAIITY